VIGAEFRPDCGQYRTRARRETELVGLLRELRDCRICADRPSGPALPHEPRPVFQISPTARIAVFSQAPGLRAHVSGTPFNDPSGVRLREWMGVAPEEFYDPSRVAIAPMGFCFPGYDAKGGDLPPRKECAPHWRARLLDLLPQLELVLLVGAYAQKWHLGEMAGRTLTETVSDHARILRRTRPPCLALPHPSWRNNAWIKRNPWFADELLPALRAEVRRRL
jgi:uracil-DNA glycosylase